MLKKSFILFILIFNTFLFSNDNIINIGIAPHSSPRVILETHQDLRIFLEKYFKRQVQIVSAKNFSEFAKRSNQGNFYDLILTSPNLALLAKKNASYVPMMTYTKGLTSIIIAKDENILGTKNYPFKVVGLDPVSFATLTAEEWLESQNLNDGKELDFTYSSASDSAATILLNNQADMSIMSLPNYLKLNAQIKNKVHIIYKSSPKPSRIYLAKAKNDITIEEWKKALEAFSKSKEGEKHLKITKLEGFKIIPENELDSLERISNKTEKRLNK